MAIFKDEKDGSSTFSGGVMSQAIAKHRHGKKDKKAEISEHLKAAEEHLHAAQAAHESGGAGAAEETDSASAEGGLANLMSSSEA